METLSPANTDPQNDAVSSPPPPTAAADDEKIPNTADEIMPDAENQSDAVLPNTDPETLIPQINPNSNSVEIETLIPQINPNFISEQPEVSEPSPKKQKQIEIPEIPSPTPETTPLPKPPTSKKSKKKSKDVWTTTTRKGKKKTKHASTTLPAPPPEEKILIAPIPRFPDKNDDSPDAKICLSKAYKAEKVELSDDRLTAGSTKGYRMVRATRGVSSGAWYFEIRIVHLGESGHARLGWSTEKGDLQAPVGYDRNSFGYRDLDGSKVHKAVREKYGEGFRDGDVIGFYISLPGGEAYAPDPPRLVLYKGQRYVCAPDHGKEEAPKVVPGSEISYFKNGICQGVAFRDLYGGRYYPAASMYTLPNQPNCVVKFNFGPDFEKFPEDFGERSAPRPMIEVPYESYEGAIENGVSNEKQK